MSLKVAALSPFVALVLLLAAPAADARPMVASGTFTQVSFVVTSSRQAGNVTLLSFEETDSLTGTFTGTSQLTGNCVMFADGDLLCRAREAFEGTVAGASGGAEFVDVVRIDAASGTVEGGFTIVSSSGGLTGLHGHGTFEGVGTTGTYSGKLVLT